MISLMCETFCSVDIVNILFTLFTLVLFILRRLIHVFLVLLRFISLQRQLFKTTLIINCLLSSQTVGLESCYLYCNICVNCNCK